MTRCAVPHPNPLPRGEGSIVLSPSGGKLDRGLATGAGMTAWHLLPQSAGYASNVLEVQR